MEETSAALTFAAATALPIKRTLPCLNLQHLWVWHAVDQRFSQHDVVGGLVAVGIHIAQFDGAPALNNGTCGAPHCRKPLGDLVGIAHCCRQGHETHGRLEVNDHLFPHWAAIGILQEVHLVEHHHMQRLERRRACINHVA